MGIMIPAMAKNERNLKGTTRLQGGSLPEVKRAFGEKIAYYSAEYRSGRRRPSEAHFLNALVIYFLDLEEDRQRIVLAKGFRRLEKLCARDEVKGPWKKPRKRQEGEQDGGDGPGAGGSPGGGIKPADWESTGPESEDSGPAPRKRKPQG